MNFIKTELEGAYIIEPKVFGDSRGYFFESFKQEEFEKHIGPVNFIQDNESKSSYGVLRGLHLQKPPYTQAKLVRVISGEVLDVIVDVRTDSSTFGKHISVKLSGENKKQLFVPRGFAHGFVVLSSEAIFSYKVDNRYDIGSELGINYKDTFLSVEWSICNEEIIISDKDKSLDAFDERLFFSSNEYSNSLIY